MYRFTHLEPILTHVYQDTGGKGSFSESYENIWFYSSYYIYFSIFSTCIFQSGIKQYKVIFMIKESTFLINNELILLMIGIQCQPQKLRIRLLQTIEAGPRTECWISKGLHLLMVYVHRSWAGIHTAFLLSDIFLQCGLQLSLYRAQGRSWWLQFTGGRAVVGWEGHGLWASKCSISVLLSESFL